MNHVLNVRFWGVRGSIASPGAETAIVGGNTSSVELSFGDERILFDAGTGLRSLGDSLLGAPVKATMLLSHVHWDHIQGIPFFVPLYLPTTELHVVGAKTSLLTLEETLAYQMNDPVFPVRFDQLASRVSTQHVRAGETFGAGSATVTVAKGNHPGGVLAYRVEIGGRAIVYATDTEHFACLDPELERLARGADLLIYDAQYTEEEYRGARGRSKVGWGHSTYVAAAELANAANVKQLALFHHDPSRTDRGVDEIESKARALFANTTAAREGLTIGFEPADRVVPVKVA